jgi:hypothetical protein
MRPRPNWGFADQAATVRPQSCEALADGSRPGTGDAPRGLDGWTGASEEARLVRDALKCVISQAAGS